MTLLLLAGVLLLMAEAPAQASHDPCEKTFTQGTTLSLQMTATRDGNALANGAAVKTGDTISLNLNWNPDEYAGSEVRLGGVCFRVGGAPAPGLNVSETPIPNDGSFQHSFSVPELKDGDELCVRGQLMGTETAQGQSVQRSDILCFTRAAPEVAPTQAPPAAPTTEVLGQTVSQPAAVAPQEAAPSQAPTQAPTQVLGVQTVRLPVTGPMKTGAVAVVALVLIAAGIVLVRRARPSGAPTEPS